MQQKVLTAVEFERIREATLMVMDRTGVEFKDCPEAHEIFAANGCRIVGDRVHFPPQAVRQGLALVPELARGQGSGQEQVLYFAC